MESIYKEDGVIIIGDVEYLLYLSKALKEFEEKKELISELWIKAPLEVLEYILFPYLTVNPPEKFDKRYGEEFIEFAGRVLLENCPICFYFNQVFNDSSIKIFSDSLRINKYLTIIKFDDSFFTPYLIKNEEVFSNALKESKNLETIILPHVLPGDRNSCCNNKILNAMVEAIAYKKFYEKKEINIQFFRQYSCIRTIMPLPYSTKIVPLLIEKKLEELKDRNKTPFLEMASSFLNITKSTLSNFCNII